MFCPNAGVHVPADLADVGVVLAVAGVGTGGRIDDGSTMEAGR